MLLRLVLTLAISTSIAAACSCIEISVKDAKKGADVVFLGTVTGFRDSPTDRRMVVFQVDRVWKGSVPKVFEMPAFEETTACLGFWRDFLKIGNQLLVYAWRMGTPPAYMTSICTRTALAKDSKDLQKLGSGRKPK